MYIYECLITYPCQERYSRLASFLIINAVLQLILEPANNGFWKISSILLLLVITGMESPIQKLIWLNWSKSLEMLSKLSFL